MELDASPIVNPVPQRLCSKIGKTKGGRRLDRSSSSSSYHLIQCVQKRCGAREDGRKEGRKEEHHIRSAIDSRVRRRRRQRRWRRGPNLWIESRAIDKMENGRLHCWSPSRARLCVMAHCEPACPPPSTTTPSSYCLSFEWTWWLAECDSQVDRRRGAAKRKREKMTAGNPSKSSDGGRRVGQWRNDSIGQLQKTERPVRSTRAR